MSSSPKHNNARLEQQQRERLEAERRRRAEEEARKRQEAAERERKRRLEALRAREMAEAQEVEKHVQRRRGELYSEDARRLEERCRQLLTALRQAGTEEQVHAGAQPGPQILRELDRAADRKRRDDEERQRVAEIERLGATLAASERRLQGIPSADARKFDADGMAAAHQSITAARKAIDGGVPTAARGPVAAAERVVEGHADTVAKRRAEWLRRKAEAEKRAGELGALLEGLRADPVALRWGGPVIAEVAAAVETSERALAEEQFDRLGGLLAEAEKKTRVCIEKANAAQLKADQRDYIAQSIAAVLQEMGFVVGAPQPEHGELPATALQIQAADYTGRAIGVSVPFEGEVWYDVNGYPKRVEALKNGATGKTCDEAEAVLNAMGEALNEAFGIRMSKITWDGKPEPELRKWGADELPEAGGGIAGGGHR